MAEESGKTDLKVSGDKKAAVPGTQFLKYLSLPSTLCTRSNAIQSMVAAKGGDHLWACCNDGTLIVWDTMTGDVIACRQAHKATIFELICVSNEHNPFARSDFTIWAACMDSTVTLWNPSLCGVKKLILGASSATALVQVGDSVYVADAKQIFVFDSQTYELIARIDLPQLAHLMPDGMDDSIAAVSSHGYVPSTFKLNMGDSTSAATLVRPMPQNAEAFSGYFVRCMALVGKYVWVCTDGFVCFVDSTTLSVVPSVCIPIAKVNSLVYVASTQQVWGGCSDCSIYIWDASAPSFSAGSVPHLNQLKGFSSDRVSKLANFNDTYIYSGSWDKKLRVWDASTHSLLFESSRLHECPIMAIVPLTYPWLKLYQYPQQQPQNQPNNADSTTPSNRDRLSSSGSSQNDLSAPSFQSSSSRRDTPILPPDLPGIPRSNSQESQLSATESARSTGSSIASLVPTSELASIFTVVTADWSSVSLWV